MMRPRKQMARLQTRLMPLVFVLAFAVACGRGGSELSREEQQYEVVQEGAASGVTSTIVAGGETPPTMAPTGTGADTTTTFTLSSSPTAPSGQVPGNLAGTLPQTTGGYAYPSGTPDRPRRAPVTPAPQPVPVTPQPEPQPVPSPTPTETQPADEPSEETAAEEEPEEEPEPQEQPPPAPPPGDDTSTGQETPPDAEASPQSRV